MAFNNSTELPKNNVISMVLKKMLCAFVHYFDGRLHQFYLDENHNLKLKLFDKTVKNTGSPSPVIIVSRKFYREEANSYPVDSSAELRKLLSFEFTSKNSRYHVWQQKNGESLVNAWHFDSEVPTGVLTLPESLLFALSTEINQVSEIKHTRTLFVGRMNGLIQSALSTDIIDSPQYFCMSTGVANNQKIHTVQAEYIPTQLANGIKRCGVSVLSSFVKFSKALNYKEILKKIFLPFTLVFGIYMFTASLYLVTKNHSVQEQLQLQEEQVNNVLNQQQEFDHNKKRYSALKSFIGEKRNSALLWLIMRELFEHAKFTNIRMVGERYVLRGTTDSSTELLARISQFDAVKNATFDFPTRKSKGTELFVIGFNLLSNLKTDATLLSNNGTANQEEHNHEGN